MSSPYSVDGNYDTYQVLKQFETLLAAGAYDTPREVSLVEFASISLFLSYLRGAATGSVALIVEVSPHANDADAPANTAVWYSVSILENGAITPGTAVASNIQNVVTTFRPTSANTEGIIIGSINAAETVSRLRVSVAENGDVANPGDCSLILLGAK